MRIAIVLVIVVLTLSCNNREHDSRRLQEYQKRLIDMEKAGIIAGPSEPTFEEKHGVRLNLPLPETEFLRILKTLKLEYNLYADRGSSVPIPSLIHGEGLKHPPNLAEINRVYQIMGDIDRTRKSQEVYRAYVDKNGFVVFLENTYSYAAP